VNSIVFTGGGSAGHVTPNIDLIKRLLEEGWEVKYIGSYDGMEKNIIEQLPIKYFGISTGKLRRYKSWQNFIDPFRILKGIFQSVILLRKIKPKVLFSKGGFVAFPSVFAAWLCRVPVIVHESDMSPGLANKLSFPFASKICLTFEASKKYFSRQEKLCITGTPIRKELFNGDEEKARTLCQFDSNKPCLLVIGGGQGAESINTVVRQSLDRLTVNYSIIHLCGKGKLDKALEGRQDYFQLEYANQELADFFALSKLVISRSGANSVYELLALKIPHIFIPLSRKASRGDQIENANYFAGKGVSVILEEEKLTVNSLCEQIHQTFSQLETIKEKLDVLDVQSASDQIITLIKKISSLN